MDSELLSNAVLILLISSFLYSALVSIRLKRAEKQFEFILSDINHLMNEVEKDYHATFKYKKLKYSNFDTDNKTVTLLFDDIPEMWDFLENHENKSKIKLITDNRIQRVNR